MKNSKLSAEEIERALEQLNGGLQTPWLEQQGKLCKSFTFASFGEAFAFMTQLALVAEQVDHHPDWRNCYRRVEIALSSFDVRGLSQRDFDFALCAERAGEKLLREL